MQISADNIFVHNALFAVLGVVSAAVFHRAERVIIARVGSAAVIFEPYDGRRYYLAVEHYVADKSAGFLLSVYVEQLRAGYGFVVELIILAEKLISAADRED